MGGWATRTIRNNEVRNNGIYYKGALKFEAEEPRERILQIIRNNEIRNNETYYKGVRNGNAARENFTNIRNNEIRNNETYYKVAHVQVRSGRAAIFVYNKTSRAQQSSLTLERVNTMLSLGSMLLLAIRTPDRSVHIACCVATFHQQ